MDTTTEVSNVQSELGAIYEKDLGPKTTNLAEAMTSYDPDSTWRETKLSLTGGETKPCVDEISPPRYLVFSRSLRS
jgi:hypothetical protein